MLIDSRNDYDAKVLIRTSFLLKHAIQSLLLLQRGITSFHQLQCFSELVNFSVKQ